MLTQQQLDARAGKLTASRIGCLMQGDAEKVLRLYKEMIGEEQPEDLSRVWSVQLGIATEALQLDWFERKNKLIVTCRGEVIVHPNHPWAAATLDGSVNVNDGLNYPIEAKHVGGREPLEVVIDRYQPQMQWQMFVTGARQCALSVIVGANEPVVEYIERADDYIAEMVRRGEQFMRCVEARRPPVTLPPVPAPVDASKIYDMLTNNTWAAFAPVWLNSAQAKKINEDAEKTLKSIVPPDAVKCFGHGVKITRDRAGRLSLREDSGKP
jgi:predicted phage-related endonuclease